LPDFSRFSAIRPKVARFQQYVLSEPLAKFAFRETFSFPLPGGGKHEAAMAEELPGRPFHLHRLVDLPVLGEVAVPLEPLTAHLALQRCLQDHFLAQF
jgi:hypothetical protein